MGLTKTGEGPCERHTELCTTFTEDSSRPLQQLIGSSTSGGRTGISQYVSSRMKNLSIRDMAEEAALKPVYTLNYQPLSSEAHGEWTSLRTQDLRVCVNPLHRFHRVARFSEGSSITALVLLQMAVALAFETIRDVFAYYSVDVSDALQQCADNLSVLT